MTKEILINQAISILGKSGHTVSQRCNIRPRSFDIAAGNGDVLLLIKVLSNVDGLKEDTAQEMLQLSEYLDGSPLVIGEKTRDHPLESGVVYYRYGIPSINMALRTVELFDEGKHGSGLVICLSAFLRL